jgi:hypothetical protein
MSIEVTVLPLSLSPMVGRIARPADESLADFSRASRGPPPPPPPATALGQHRGAPGGPLRLPSRGCRNWPR